MAAVAAMSTDLDALPELPADAILSVMGAFRDDPTPGKVDLTVGVYRDESGRTPVMRAIAAAERALVEEQDTKAYMTPLGAPGFLEGMTRMVLGEVTDAIRPRCAVIQTPGGCGALRLGAELVNRARAGAPILLGEPTWALHDNLLGGAGLRLERFACYDDMHRRFEPGPMLDAMGRAARGTAVLLQASCYNPTGADPDTDQWREILRVIEARGLVPFFDVAYQGLGRDLDADVFALREAARTLPEFLVAVSCSKNFGLYRERTGVLCVVAGSTQRRRPLESQLLQIARTMYSMPPAHGALLVERVLSDPDLRATWRTELGEMAARLQSTRAALVRAVALLRPELDLGWLTRQQGMFSLLGISPGDVDLIRQRDHVYMLGDGRINIAGLNDDNVAAVARAVAPMLR
jgi:aspartate aminotransferase